MIEWMKEILGDAYTEDIDNKITARLTADYAPKADLEAANTAKSEAEAALAAANDKYKDVDIDALRADAEKYKAEAAQARKDGSFSHLAMGMENPFFGLSISSFGTYL